MSTRNRTCRWELFRDEIVKLVGQRPDITLQELKEALQTSLSRQTLCNALQKLKLTLKKKS